MDRIPRSTLSNFHQVADPSVLQPIVDMLQGHLQARSAAGTPLALPELLGQVLAVDGSFISVAADVAWAFNKSRGRGVSKGGRPKNASTSTSSSGRRAVRLDVHLDVATWLPQVISVADGESEAEHAATAIVPEAVHVYDRGIFSYELVAAHAQKRAHFVHRLRKPGPRTPTFRSDEDRTTDEADRQAGVISDRLGMLGNPKPGSPTQRLREVVIQSPDDPDREIRLLTDLLDIPAWVIGQIYRNRWQVELCFRWLKSCARFGNLWSEHRSGVLLQFYSALIAMLLVYLRTGMRPSKYAMNLLAMVVAGTASWEEIRPILADRDRERRLDRERLERKRAAKKS